MSKVSATTSIVGGLVDPKPRPKGASDGQTVNIPLLQVVRYSNGVTKFEDLRDRMVGHLSSKSELVGKSANSFI